MTHTERRRLSRARCRRRTGRARSRTAVRSDRDRYEGHPTASSSDRRRRWRFSVHGESDDRHLFRPLFQIGFAAGPPIAVVRGAPTPRSAPAAAALARGRTDRNLTQNLGLEPTIVRIYVQGDVFTTEGSPQTGRMSRNRTVGIRQHSCVVELVKTPRQLQGPIDVITWQRVMPLRREILPGHSASPTVPLGPVNAMRQDRAARRRVATCAPRPSGWSR